MMTVGCHQITQGSLMVNMDYEEVLIFDNDSVYFGSESIEVFGDKLELTIVKLDLEKANNSFISLLADILVDAHTYLCQQ